MKHVGITALLATVLALGIPAFAQTPAASAPAASAPAAPAKKPVQPLIWYVPEGKAVTTTTATAAPKPVASTPVVAKPVAHGVLAVSLWRLVAVRGGWVTAAACQAEKASVTAADATAKVTEHLECVH